MLSVVVVSDVSIVHPVQRLPSSRSGGACGIQARNRLADGDAVYARTHQIGKRTLGFRPQVKAIPDPDPKQAVRQETILDRG